MKRYIVAIGLLFLVCGVEVDAKSLTLGMSLDSLRKSVKMQAHNGTRWPDSQYNEAINRGISETCRVYPALVYLDTLIFTTDSMGVSVNSDFDRIASAQLKIGNTAWIPVVILDPDTAFVLANSMDDFIDNPASKSKMYFAYSYMERIYTIPKVRTVAGKPDSMLLFYYAIDSVLTTDANTALIKAKYRDKVIEYAMSVLFSNRYEFQRADYWLNRFKGVIGPNDVGISRSQR